MGNYVSCALATSLTKSGKAARVLLPSGVLRHFRHPTKAADLMLDSPNFFLANARSLHIGRRFSALSADDDLEFGNLYVMFPMKRLGSLVTAADMALLFMAANSASKRLAPAPTQAEVDGHANGQPISMVSDGGLSEGITEHLPEMMKYRLSACRSRKPLLETISEESVCSR